MGRPKKNQINDLPYYSKKVEEIELIESKKISALEKTIESLEKKLKFLQNENLALKEKRTIKYDDPKGVWECIPCPKCHEQKLAIEEINNICWVYCKSCKHAGSKKTSKKMAMIEWNLQ